ncbi:hypothetical protein HDU87_006814 [Geranomyces variabilis]|uniref:Uncharacterized protein n=1 Tax=Geranomyces variabilis TaxID=109894 RepID=A0AAD5TUR4_9FUNG|nr:hypothetical protein HDU87_006814 [Geranomyces variabilis]
MSSATTPRLANLARCHPRKLSPPAIRSRPTSSSSSASSSSAPPYPYPVYFLPAQPPSRTTALSFLSTTPSSSQQQPTAAAIIGWAKRKDITDLADITPAEFEANPAFEEVLHDVIKQNIDGDVGVQGLAAYQKLGYLNINDERTYAPFGRVSDPEDILGSCRLDDGKLVAGSYERMPTHRLFSFNGLFRLSEHLQDKLLERLRNGGGGGGGGGQ